MSNLYPPILESQRSSRPEGEVNDQIYVRPILTPPSFTTGFLIPFTMPLSVDTTQIGHVQVLIQRQANMDPWSNQLRTASVPERDIIYLQGTRAGSNSVHNQGGLRQVPNSDLWYVEVPKDCIRGKDSMTGGDSGVRGFPAGIDGEGETFTIQIRFGDSVLDFGAASNFASWKQRETKAGGFGEWSNTQRMFIYALPDQPIINVTASDSPIAHLSWDYRPRSIDPLEQVRITYSWSTPDDDAYGNQFRSKNLEIVSNDGRGASASGEIDFGVMRFVPITVTVHFTTVNNTVFIFGENNSYKIPAFNFVESTPKGSINTLPIVGEEIEDGVLGMTFEWTVPSAESQRLDYRIYRVDLRTLETIHLKFFGAPIGGTGGISTNHIKDYSVEMGAEYVYMGFGFKRNPPYGAENTLVWDSNLGKGALNPPPPAPINWKPHKYPGYARQMNFHGNTFLTTKWQQLKLQGNVSVNNFNRNVSDQFTTTIGGQYPFYSRSAQFNYRTLSLQGAIALELDPTNTFLDFRYQLNAANSEFSAWMKWALDIYQHEITKLNQSNTDSKSLEYKSIVTRLQLEYYSRIEKIYKGVNPNYPNQPRVPGTNDPYPGITTYNQTSFLQGEKPFWMDGQLWLKQDADNRQLILRSTELFSDEQISMNIKRVQDFVEQANESLVRANINAQIDNDVYIRDVGWKRGPTSEYDENFGRNGLDIRFSSDRPSEKIYAERKYREAVMQWMVNGLPKLFRSETEGNMIVVLSGVSFTPLNKNRHIYSLSATVTEVAEYNIANLILYGLVPVDFAAFYLPGIEFGFISGSKDNTI